MSNPFDYVFDISSGKKNIIKNSESPEQAEKDYNPYIVNKALSHYIDTVHDANVMNLYHKLDNRLQFDYLINSVRSRKRAKTQWYKKEKGLSNLDIVMLTYGYTKPKAEAALSILTEQQIALLKAKQEQR